MKAIVIFIVASLTVLYSLNTIAQETGEAGNDDAQDSQMYLEEIRSTCEAEAAGLPDAEAYIRECINNMMQSFANPQE